MAKENVSAIVLTMKQNALLLIASTCGLDKATEQHLDFIYKIDDFARECRYGDLPQASGLPATGSVVFEARPGTHPDLLPDDPHSNLVWPGVPGEPATYPEPPTFLTDDQTDAVGEAAKGAAIDALDEIELGAETPVDDPDVVPPPGAPDYRTVNNEVLAAIAKEDAKG